MKLRELIESKDGSLSMTKLFATIGHINLAASVMYLTYVKEDFIFDMWVLYVGAVILHAGYDKTLAIVKDIKQNPHTTNDNTK